MGADKSSPAGRDVKQTRMSEQKKEDAKPTSFRNEYHKGIINLMLTFTFVSDQLKEIFQREDLTLQQFNILRILRGKHPQSVTNSYIKANMIDKNSDVTRIVDRLIKVGLVSRGYSCEDRRKVAICITETGLDVLSRLDKCKHEEDAILSSLNETEIRQFNSLLQKIRS